MRPEARKKLGYYPAAPEAIESIIPRLVPPADRSALAALDPCAGEGLAIKQLADGLKLPYERVWAVELDAKRGEACQAALPCATILSPCSFLQTDIRYGCYSLIFANPPFDDSLEKHLRVEEQFLSRSLQLLVKGGVLLFVCPESIAYRPGFQHILSTYADHIDVVPFPRFVRKHDEVFVLAQRIEGFRMEKCSWRDLLAVGNCKYMLPKAPGPGVRFKKTGLTDDEIAGYLERSTLLEQFAAPPEFTLPAPPLALGKGHLALLLASGHLDGLVTVDGSSHVVRGTATKVEEQTDQEVDKSQGTTVTKTTYSEKIRLTVRAAWPDGEITTLE
jgi:hypothetical protein